MILLMDKIHWLKWYIYIYSLQSWICIPTAEGPNYFHMDFKKYCEMEMKCKKINQLNQILSNVKHEE